MKRILTSALLLLASSLIAASGVAQTSPADDDTWNSPRALELIRRAQDRRSAANADSGLTSYQSDARIFVYFYLDRPDTGERNLVKTDQLALEVFWRAPEFTKQRIVGWRDEKSLPTNINYHLDHLTVVQENFGDEIRLGDGDEVTNVVHPAAPGADVVYEYRLADSLTLRLPGTPDPVRVYELQVRPLDLNSPGFLGSVFVERRAGDIVRMDFTFTESSYVDRYLDYINISLDNGLWQGRYWLPNEQRVEIRRRIPELDIPAGSVIRANMQVGNYRFDVPMPPAFFAGPAVVALPRSQREVFPFEEDIHAQVREEGIGPHAELGEIRRLAAELVDERALRRSTGVRPRLGSASETLRYNRAEGTVLSAGVTASPLEGLMIAGRAGWATGPEHALGSATFNTRVGATRVRARFYLNEPRDPGSRPVASGVLNTLASLVAGEDYADPFYTSGGSLTVSQSLGSTWAVELEGRAERHRSAWLASDFSVFGDLRPVAEVDATNLMLEGRVGLRRASGAEAAEWLHAGLFADFGHMDPLSGSEASEAAADPGYLRPRVDLEWGRRWLAADAELRLGAEGGLAFGELPVQALYRMGGRGTVPGYRFRAYGGDRYIAGRAVFSADLRAPWLRGRLLAAAGWVDAGDVASSAMARAALRPSGQVLPSVGVGLGIFHDIIHVDVARGLGSGGGWEIVVDANPGFWDFL